MSLAYRLMDETLEEDKPVEEIDYARASLARALARLGRQGEAVALAATVRGRGLRAYTLASIAEAGRSVFPEAAAMAEELAEGLEPAARLYVEARLAEAECRWRGDGLGRLARAAGLLPAAGWRGAARLAVAYAACGAPGSALEEAGRLPGPRERGYALSEAAYALRRGDAGFLERVYREVSAVEDSGLRYVFLSRALAAERLVDPGLARIRAEGLLEAAARISGFDAVHVQPVVVGNIFEAGLGEAAEAAAAPVVEQLAPLLQMLPFDTAEAVVKVALYYLGAGEAARTAEGLGGAMALAVLASALDSWARTLERVGW